MRAWHAHREERKWVMAVRGRGARLLRRDRRLGLAVDRRRDPPLLLDAANPAVLEVPAGYANGAMSLLPETKLLYLSDAPLDASLADDVRFPARLWDPWQIPER